MQPCINFPNINFIYLAVKHSTACNSNVLIHHSENWVTPSTCTVLMWLLGFMPSNAWYFLLDVLEYVLGDFVLCRYCPIIFSSCRFQVCTIELGATFEICLPVVSNVVSLYSLFCAFCKNCTSVVVLCRHCGPFLTGGLRTSLWQATPVGSWEEGVCLPVEEKVPWLCFESMLSSSWKIGFGLIERRIIKILTLPKLIWIVCPVVY